MVNIMLSIRNIFKLKTSALGILLLVFSYLKVEVLDKYVLIFLIVSGIGLLLVPDTILTGLKRLITRKSKEI